MCFGIIIGFLHYMHQVKSLIYMLLKNKPYYFLMAYIIMPQGCFFALFVVVIASFSLYVLLIHNGFVKQMEGNLVVALYATQHQDFKTQQ